MLISFIVLFESAAFKAKFTFFDVPENSSLLWVATAAVPAVREVMKKMEVNVSRRRSAPD